MRQLIVRFTSYKKQKKFLQKKSKLKRSQNFCNAFITEDLTPLRSKLFEYLKETGKGEFVLFHTINGKIRMKKSAKKFSQILGENEKDEGVANKWLYISLPDDLLKHGIELNFQQLYYKPLLFNDFYDNDTTIGNFN